ncbi:MAG TPA: M24 family metallopeptidase, partial [Ktedonobacterales bacterium]|nr:M24 family metallopeptidase [Ktedonobacterales bacterium]
QAEIAVIRRAAELANQAFARLVAGLRPGMTERQIAATLERHMIDLGADEPGFDTIVACGPGGALPHWSPSDREARVGEPILIDFGCRVSGYCSDLTRTICLGEPDAKLREVYALVRAAQDAGLAALKAGVRRGRDVDAAARKVFDDAGHGKEFIHSLGHGVGLAVHELPSLGWLRVQTPERDAELAKVEQIETNAIVTNEPGLYFAGWGAVRLEDMILVEESDAVTLTDRNPEQILCVRV